MWNRTRAAGVRVVQSAFLKAYQSLGRFREGAAFGPWLLRIAVNETRNTVRTAVRLRALAGRQPWCLDRVYPGGRSDPVWIHTSTELRTQQGARHKAAGPAELRLLLTKLGSAGPG
ncbi:sigma factor [Streptomyces lunaelactis]|uniref:sigma factor n=1 Tax=Streptomyces lunaelactis TaxID=1535768 RepID=UPI0035A1A3B3